MFHTVFQFWIVPGLKLNRFIKVTRFCLRVLNLCRIFVGGYYRRSVVPMCPLPHRWYFLSANMSFIPTTVAWNIFLENIFSTRQRIKYFILNISYTKTIHQYCSTFQVGFPLRIKVSLHSRDQVVTHDVLLLCPIWSDRVWSHYPGTSYE